MKNLHRHKVVRLRFLWQPDVVDGAVSEHFAVSQSNSQDQGTLYLVYRAWACK